MPGLECSEKILRCRLICNTTSKGDRVSFILRWIQRIILLYRTQSPKNREIQRHVAISTQFALFTFGTLVACGERPSAFSDHALQTRRRGFRTPHTPSLQICEPLFCKWDSNCPRFLTSTASNDPLPRFKAESRPSHFSCLTERIRRFTNRSRSRYYGLPNSS